MSKGSMSQLLQTTNPLIARPLSGSPNCDELRLFGAKALHLLILLMSRIWHSSSRYNVFSYDAVWAEHRTRHLPNAEQIRYVLCHGQWSSPVFIASTFRLRARGGERYSVSIFVCTALAIYISISFIHNTHFYLKCKY